MVLVHVSLSLKAKEFIPINYIFFVKKIRIAQSFFPVIKIYKVRSYLSQLSNIL
jgi:hypothetical protein